MQQPALCNYYPGRPQFHILGTFADTTNRSTVHINDVNAVFQYKGTAVCRRADTPELDHKQPLCGGNEVNHTYIVSSRFHSNHPSTPSMLTALLTFFLHSALCELGVYHVMMQVQMYVTLLLPFPLPPSPPTTSVGQNSLIPRVLPSCNIDDAITI